MRITKKPNNEANNNEYQNNHISYSSKVVNSKMNEIKIGNYSNQPEYTNEANIQETGIPIKIHLTKNLTQKEFINGIENNRVSDDIANLSKIEINNLKSSLLRQQDDFTPKSKSKYINELENKSLRNKSKNQTIDNKFNDLKTRNAPGKYTCYSKPKPMALSGSNILNKQNSYTRTYNINTNQPRRYEIKTYVCNNNNYNNEEFEINSISAFSVNQQNNKYMVYSPKVNKLINKINNNYLPMDSKRSEQFTHHPNITNITNDLNYSMAKNQNSTFINMQNINYMNNEIIEIKSEDLICFDERINDIQIALKDKGASCDRTANNECLEFFSFYFHSSLKYILPNFFEIPNRIIIKSALNLNFFTVIMTYHLSINPSLLKEEIFIFLINIFYLLGLNFYLIIKKIQLYYGPLYVKKNELYFRTFNLILKRNGFENINESEIIRNININCHKIVIDVQKILGFYQKSENPFYADFMDIFNNISSKGEKDIYNYFVIYLSNRPHPKYKIITTPNYINPLINEYQLIKATPPYIKVPSNKKFTLVFDLNETLLKIFNKNDINFRPGLFKFLSKMKESFELISYTNEKREFMQPFINKIELSEKYFQYNLFLEHNDLINNSFVKNINKIGRDISKIIIIGSSYDNFFLYPQNGIKVYPYLGDDSKKDTLFFDLKHILLSIIKTNIDDVRVALKQFENEIKIKITNNSNN